MNEIKILIINPNSSVEMTRIIEKNARVYVDGEFQVDCHFNKTAPPFIGCYEDIAKATEGMIEIVKNNEDKYDGFVIACHSDPNLDLLKEISHKPIVGIGEASMKVASMLGHKFSVISTGQHPIPNKEDLIVKYGLERSLASVVGPETLKADWHHEGVFLEAAKKAILKDKCEVIVLGCAGMGHITEKMQGELGVPVIDGVVAALIIVTGLVKSNLSISKVRRYKNKV